jgi:hypothetical protein
VRVTGYGGERSKFSPRSSLLEPRTFLHKGDRMTNRKDAGKRGTGPVTASIDNTGQACLEVLRQE